MRKMRSVFEAFAPTICRPEFEEAQYTVQQSARPQIEFPFYQRWEIHIVGVDYLRDIETGTKAQRIVDKLNVFQSEDLKAALRQQLATT